MFFTVCCLLQTLRACLDGLSVTGAPLKDLCYQAHSKPEEKKNLVLNIDQGSIFLFYWSQIKNESEAGPEAATRKPTSWN